MTGVVVGVLSEASVGATHLCLRLALLASFLFLLKKVFGIVQNMMRKLLQLAKITHGTSQKRKNNG